MAQEISFCVFTTSAASEHDLSPRRYVSEAQLQHYKAMELAALAFAAALSAVPALGKVARKRPVPALCSRAKCRRLHIAANRDA